MTNPPPIRIDDLSWTEFEVLAPRLPYWLLVTGSMEQHGPHLPLSADTLVVERLAEITAAAHGVLILGTVRVGVLHAFVDWPGSQRVPADVFGAQVRALADVAVPHANRLMVLNGHDENHEPLLTAARELNDSRGTDVLVVEWAQLVTDVIRKVSESTGESHAGEALTSLFLHWYPQLVRTGLMQPGVRPAAGLAADDLHVAKRAHHVVRFERKKVPTGVLGDPTRASAEKGAVIASALVERVDLLVQERGWR
jgi:creatinine amidohydrolase